MSESADRQQESATEVGARLGTSVGAAVGSAVGSAGGVLSHGVGQLQHGVGQLQESEAVRVAAGRAAEAGQALAATLDRLPPLDAVREAALGTVRSAVEALPEVLEGVVEEARGRGVDAALALRGRRRPVRTWPWSVGAAVAGAAAGAGAVLLLRKVLGQDAPDALEPEQLVAVVDPLPLDGTTGPGTASAGDAQV